MPSVIGIERITNILKNGDLVEVDANKGIIKKYENKPNIITSTGLVANLGWRLEHHFPLPFCRKYVQLIKFQAVPSCRKASLSSGMARAKARRK